MEGKEKSSCLGLKVLALHVFRKKNARRESSEVVEFKKACGGRGQGRTPGSRKEAKIGKGGGYSGGGGWHRPDPELGFLLSPVATGACVHSTEEPCPPAVGKEAFHL